MKNLNIAYLGPKSYPAVLEKIYEALGSVECSTLTGKELVKETLQRLDESATPILDLKVFTTNAEKVAPNDIKLMDVIAFARKEVKEGDLNCLINIAKEEHLQEQSRTNMPTPEATIKNWEEIMNKPASDIEIGIKNGLFKDLNSKLYMELDNILTDDGKGSKSKNKITPPEDHYEGNILNENFSMSPSQNVIVYAPIGVRMEDPENNRVVMLTESAALQYDRNMKAFFSLNESDMANLKVPERHQRLMTAVTRLAYNPEKEVFSLNENWDFDIALGKDGALLTKNGHTVKMETADLPQFLMESIDAYCETDSKLDRKRYTQDADNMVMLAENWNHLHRIDTVRVIRNTALDKFAIVDTREGIVPTFISSSVGPKLFENYADLAKEAGIMLNESIEPLFSSHMDNENSFYQDRRNKISMLTEAQKDINHLLKNIKGLKTVAEENSPAMDRLDENERLLSVGLTKNINAMNRVMNMSSPYGMSLNESIQEVMAEDFDTYVQSAGWQPVTAVLTPLKISNLLNEMESTDECRLLVSEDMSHFLAVYQNHFTAEWTVDLWSPLEPYTAKFKQNNFGSREELIGYLGTVSEAVEEMVSNPASIAKAA